MTTCTLKDNEAKVKGGGIFNFKGQLELKKCVVVGNSAGHTGGGVVNRGIDGAFAKYWAHDGTVVSGNTAPNSPDVYNYNVGIGPF